KKLSQREVCADSTIPQGQYTRSENGEVEPSISTSEKLPADVEGGNADCFNFDDREAALNLPLLRKIKMIDTLAKDEQQTILKKFDLALDNKRMKDNLKTLITQ